MIGWLFAGAGACLLLENAGTPEGYQKLGHRPHLAILTVLLIAALGLQFFLDKSSFNLESRVLVGLTGINLIFATLTAVPQMRHVKRDRGEGYALILISFALIGTLIVTRDLLVILTCTTLWTLFAAALLTFRDSRTLTASGAANWIIASLSFLALFTMCIALCLWASGSTQLDLLAKALRNAGAIGRTAWSMVWLLALFFSGTAPFFWFHLGYLDRAPSFASILFATASLLGGGAFLLKLIQVSGLATQIDTPLKNLVLVFSFAALLLPTLMALDQRRISRMCMYLMLSQTGPLLLLNLTRPTNIHLNLLLFANTALTILGVVGSLSFWKHTRNADKTWEDYAGAGHKHPLIAVSWLAVLASIVGLPGTLGFLVRMDLIQAALQRRDFLFAALVLLAPIAGAVPVVRLGVFLFAKPMHHELSQRHQPRQTFLVIISGGAVAFAGLFPRLVIQLFQQ